MTQMRLIAVLATALLLTACGTGLARAETVAPVEGGWKGKSSQGLLVYFGVREGRVVNTRYHFRWGFCGVFENHAKRASLELDPAGHWLIADPRGTSLEGTFVTPVRVEGMVIAEERMTPSCPRVEAPFVAWPRRR
jgi:hypothetical protein